MRFILLVLAAASLACAQGTKLSTPTILLQPSAGGTSLFTPQADVGGSLGTNLIRWNTIESRTYNARTAAGTTKLTQLTGNGLNGIDVLGNPTFSISTVVGSGAFTTSVGVYDGNLSGNSVVVLVPPGLAASYTLTLPTALPVSTKFLQVDNTGAMSFASSSLTVCGSDKQNIYNDSGACGADPNNTWDKATKFFNISGPGRLGINSASPGAYLDVRGSTGPGGSPIIVEETGAFGYSGVTYKDSASADKAIVGWSNTFAARSPGSFLLYTPGSDPINFSIGATVQATISITGLFAAALSTTFLTADGGLFGDGLLSVRSTATPSTASFTALNLNSTDGIAIYGENRHGSLPVMELLSNTASAGAALNLRSLGTGDLIQKSGVTVLDKNLNLFVNSCTGCGGTSYWSASGSDIQNTNVGNVGIGVAPTAKLDVNGAANIRNGLTVQSTTGNSIINLIPLSGNTWVLAALTSGRFGLFDGGSGFFPFSIEANSLNNAIYISAAGTTTLAGSIILSATTGSTQCLQANSSGVVSGTGSGCGGAPPFIDTTPIVYDSLNPTVGKIAFKANLLSAARNLTAQDFDYEIAARDHDQVFTGLDFFNPTASGNASLFTKNLSTSGYSGLRTLDSTSTYLGFFGTANAASGKPYTARIAFGSTTNHPLSIITNDLIRWNISAVGDIAPYANGAIGIGSSSFGLSTVFSEFYSSNFATGLFIDAEAGPIKLQTNFTTRWTVDFTSGDFLPGANTTYNIGATGNKPLKIWTSNLDSSGTASFGSIGSSLSPSSNITFSLGTGTGNRWLKLWAQDANISGAVDLSGAVNFNADNTTTIGSSTVRAGTIETSRVEARSTSGSSRRARIGGSGIDLFDGSGNNTLNLNDLTGGATVNGVAGFTGTTTVRNAAGSGTCTLVYDGGFRTGGTC